MRATVPSSLRVGPARQRRRLAVLALAFMGGVGIAPLAWAGSYEDFFKAVSLDNAAAVRELLQRGFDPNAPGPVRGSVGLFLAMRDGSFAVAEVLLAHPQIRVDAANEVDETPLMMAALRGHVAWMRRLLDRGATLHRVGWTPLHYAASGPSPEAVALLLDRGAVVEALSPNRTTPLMMAAGYGAQDSATLLARRGADRAARNDAGLNAADFARRAGRDRLAAELEPSVR